MQVLLLSGGFHATPIVKKTRRPIMGLAWRIYPHSLTFFLTFFTYFILHIQIPRDSSTFLLKPPSLSQFKYPTSKKEKRRPSSCLFPDLFLDSESGILSSCWVNYAIIRIFLIGDVIGVLYWYN